MKTEQLIQRLRMAAKALTASEVMTVSPDGHGQFDILSVKTDQWDVSLVDTSCQDQNPPQ